jgi:hypothetical protein
VLTNLGSIGIGIGLGFGPVPLPLWLLRVAETVRWETDLDGARAKLPPAPGKGRLTPSLGVTLRPSVWRRSPNAAVMRDLPIPGSPETSTI